MGLHVKCRGCGKVFAADDATNIGTLWQPVFVAVCPTCGAQNRSVVRGGRLDVDDVISKVVEGKYEAKKKKTPVAERVRLDAVLEYWVQRYIAIHHERLGFKDLKGPFETGPDFRVLHKGKWVYAEAEVVCENYIAHKHHQSQKWAGCKVLIVLSEKEPAAKIKPFLPKMIVRIDKAHFTAWYQKAAKRYALARQKEEPAKKLAEKMQQQLELLAAEIRRRLGIARFPSEDPAEDIFDDLAFEFVAHWIKDGEFKLAAIRAADIDRFCRSIAQQLHEQEVDLPVFHFRYCEKCDKTLIIRASRMRGFSDYETVECPHCQRDLGKIRADMGFEIVGEKKGDHGNSTWEDPLTTQEFVGIHPFLR